MIGGSGNGEQIAANKIPASAPRWPSPARRARLPRQHNDANVLSLGARMYPGPKGPRRISGSLPGGPARRATG
jgi:ribose 5-phosphate isomerase RpiB